MYIPVVIFGVLKLSLEELRFIVFLHVLWWDKTKNDLVDSVSLFTSKYLENNYIGYFR